MFWLHKQEKFLMKLIPFFQRLLLNRNQNLKPRKGYHIGFSKTTKNHKTVVLEGILNSYWSIIFTSNKIILKCLK